MGPEMATEEELASRRQVCSINTGGDRVGRLKEKKIRAPSSCSPFWISSFRQLRTTSTIDIVAGLEEIQICEQGAEEEEF